MSQSPDLNEPSETPRTHWHLDKRVSASHLLTTLSLAAALFIWGAAMDRRVTVLEEYRKVQLDMDSRQDEAMREALRELRSGRTEFREELQEMNRKLDRLIEKRS